MAKRILVTGGAGFIGSHLCNRLVADGYQVRALDNLCPQVHGEPSSPHRFANGRPAYLSSEVDLLVGDVRDSRACKRALLGVDAVVHLAARVGVGQSMYEVAEYTSVNGVGTAVLLESLIQRPIERLVVASSMSIYGEGAYVDARGTRREAVARNAEQLRRHDWEPRDARNQPLRPIPTAEDKPPSIASVYALSKFDQERMCLMLGQAYGIDTVALRLFNVYGPHQSLSNPYTGVMAIFATRLLHDRPPIINEDGLQRRDFVNVRDVVEAFVLALNTPGAAGRAYNIASGAAITIQDVARLTSAALGKAHVAAQVSGQYRVGDIRHCFANISAARQDLGFEPRVDLGTGLNELAAWIAAGQPAEDRVEHARHELASRGLAL